jgi:hypothetical protein
MQKQFFVTVILFLCINAFSLNANIDTSLIKEGDIIFQESLSEQAKAIKLATHSRYSHAGIIFKFNHEFKVLEAVQFVKYTDLHVFINRGFKHHFVIKRLKNYNSIIKSNGISQMKSIGEHYLGKNYDIYFEWNDNKIYCTELIWKIYKKALNIEVGKLERLKDFDLNHPYVKRLMYKRYGNKIPYNELVISPESMFKANNLMTIIDNEQ